MRIFRGSTTLLIVLSLIPLHLLAVEIFVNEGNWGNVKTAEIKAVLASTVSVLLPLSPVLKNKKIKVYSGEFSPKLYYDQNHNGQYLIKLSAKNRYWCQYAFQFSHELGHLICNTKRGSTKNNWFEETLCEAASLYVLEELSKVWTTTPPYWNWRSYGKEFEKYRKERIKQSAYPTNFQISSWWKQNRKLLSQNSNLRKYNLWMAIQLLNLIEKNPKTAWSACEWLNHFKSDQNIKFESYLKNWELACLKREQKQFVQKVADLFGIF